MTWSPFDPEPDTSPDPDRVAQAAAAVAATPAGRLLFDHLAAITLRRSLGPDATDAALRHLEGQRQLVTQIFTLMKRGGYDG